MKTNYEMITTAIEFISQNFRKQPELEEIAKVVHMSPFHFQKLFSEWAGISPKRFLQFLTTDYLKEKLSETKNLIEAADLAGLSAQSRVYDLFISLEAVTPQQYKTKGEGLKINYGFHQTHFGECFIGATEKGICCLRFTDKKNKYLCIPNLKDEWENAILIPNQDKTKEIVQKIFNPNISDNKLHLMVKGTNFQVKVWDALLKIPFGNLTTYQKIAEYIGSPKAVRAVGSAVGNNPIAYLIPCHRVIRKEGKIGEYKWGTLRKKAILGWEMAKV